MTKPAAKPTTNTSPKEELFEAPSMVADLTPVPRLVNDGPLFESTLPPRARRTRKPVKAAAPPQVDTPAPEWVTATRSKPVRRRSAKPKLVLDPIKPIETRYAGCRFRSRLEARYAVWFDNLQIPWLYEPETYTVGRGDRLSGYLPDFFLPTEDAWVEVKGSEAALNYQLLADAADPYYGLPLNLDGGNPLDGWATLQIRIIILGSVPASPGFHSAIATVMSSNLVRQLVTPFCDMAAVGVSDAMAKPHRHTLAPVFHPFDIDREDLSAPQGVLTSFGFGSPCPQVVGAYSAARSARFEHGESG